MRPVLLPALLASLAASAPATVAAAHRQAESTFITYSYGTVLVPLPIEPQRVIRASEFWFAGKAFPSRLGRLRSDIAISGTEIVLPAGTVVGLAQGEMLIGCTQETDIKFRLGRSRVCLIDMDGDGDFDSWFRRAGGLTFYPYSSRVSRDDIRPTGKVGVSRIPESELAGLKEWDLFWVKIKGGKLTFCAWADACSPQGVRVKPTAETQQVHFLGGAFEYQLTVDKRLKIQVRKPPGITYLGE